MTIQTYIREDGTQVRAHTRITKKEEYAHLYIIVAISIMVAISSIWYNNYLSALPMLTAYPVAKVNSPLEITDLSKTVIHEVTAYNSFEEQTDSSPCIAAYGDNICELYDFYKSKNISIFATNKYPKNTLLYVEHIGKAIVLDKMNSRYKNRLDFYVKYDYERALKFGKQNLRVLVLN